MKIDTLNLTQQDSHHLITDIVVPRPIAWVSTVDENGLFNLAPFSAYGMISSKPMLVGFSVSPKRDGQKKDTLRNIEATKEFVINIVTEDLAEPMNKSSSPYPHDVSEFGKVGLTSGKADVVKAPVVAESPVTMECRLLQILKFGIAPQMTNFIIGEVLLVHVADRFYNQLGKRISGLNVIGRLGGDNDLYCRTRDTFEMKRPSFE